MTKQEILTKAIQKAIDGGWTEGKDLLDFEMQESLMADGSYPIKHLTLEIGYEDYVNVEAVIYDHDFAKALWRDSYHSDPDNTGGCIYCGANLDSHETSHCWQYHLQMMVIADDPIKYLGENLPD